MNEAQRFANLVCELRTLLDNYFKVTEDMKSDPLTYYALFNLYLSIQVIDQYAIHDSVAIEFLKSLSDRHKEVLAVFPTNLPINTGPSNKITKKRLA